MINAMPDIPRIYTAIAEWAACLVFIMMLRPRYERKLLAWITIGFLAVQIMFLELTANIVLWLWLPCMAVAFGIMVLEIFSCCKLSVWEACYYGIFAFVIAEGTASLEWQIWCFFYAKGVTHLWLENVLLIVVYGALLLAIWKLIHRHIPQDGKLDINRKDWITAMFIGLIVFGFSNLSFLSMDTPFSGVYAREIANIRTLVDFVGIAMLYAHLVLCCENKVRMELEAVQMVLENQYQQYKLSRESIELLNYRYHDLKHQIRVLRNETDDEKRNAYLNQMEEEIRQYELQNKTGNKVLDTVLTSKSMYCAKHGISLTTVADGTLLDFMETMDICSVFGNALDNAIESVLKLAEKEKRLIHVTVSKQKQFVMISFENYFEGELEHVDDTIRTTKGDEWYHGYGIKSIRYTINKYDGAVNIKTENNWFEMKILLPISNSEK